MGERIQVFSDKAFRHSGDDVFEAVGNIIITYENATIYGDRARIHFPSGEIRVRGNARYIEPDTTIYGPEFKWNFKTKNFSLKKSRLTTNSYTISGDKIEKINANVLVAENVEYTTCHDCPESWSIFGREIYITAEQYARIKHAYIKVKGVVVLYVPYIILPIKTKRETGLLFPRMSLDFNRGFQYQQPWFWNISDHADMTLTPSLWGDRGWGSQLQFRQVLGEKKWYEINSFQVEDRIYRPNKKDLTQSGDKFFRHISDYEHHYTEGHWFNHHFNYTVTKDLDSIRDFNFYTDDRIEGSEIGGGGFFEFQNNLGQITVEGYFNRNVLFPEAHKFDHRYVQILPRMHVSVIPIPILRTSFLAPQKIFLGVRGDVTRFKQNRIDEIDVIRNAIRYNAAPYLNWKIVPIPPLKVETTISFDYQHYRFPHLAKQKSFDKRGIIYKTQAQINFEKTFDSTYKKEILRPQPPSQHSFDNIIGDLSPRRQTGDKAKYQIIRNSFKHSQSIRLKHYLLGNQRWKGNPHWRWQIEEDRGQFDLTDALRRRKHTINTLSAKTSLPLSNTLEFQWENTLVRKNPEMIGAEKDRQSYSYQKRAWFGISQGYDLDSRQNKFRKNLTRLHITGGIRFDRGSLSLSDYYFYDSRKHIGTLSGEANFSHWSVNLGLNHNPFASPRNKRFHIANKFKLSDLMNIVARYDYDLEHRRLLEQGYKIFYTPSNNCWGFELGWNQTILEKKVSFNFFLNFDRNNFRPAIPI